MNVSLNIFKGLGTRWKRSVRPLGFLDDVLNAVINKKTGALITRTGYVNDTSQPYTDVSTNTVLTTLSSVNGHNYCATESPESKDIKVLCGKTAGAVTHFFQSLFYHGSATATASYLDWGESKSLTVTTVAIPTLTISNSGQAAGYYIGWMVYNSTRNQAVYVKNQVTSTVLIVTPAPPSGWLNTDTYVAYRHFHQNPGFTPFWTRPVVRKLGNAILASGGQSTNVGAKLIRSEYLKNVYPFSGTPITHEETYVEEAEIKTGNALSVGNFAAQTTGDSLDSGYYSFAYCWETVDGQRGPLVRVNEVAVSAALPKYLTPNTGILGDGATVILSFPLLNKRMRYIHWFASKNSVSTATPPWSSYFWYGKSDLLSASDFAFTETSGSTIGFWYEAGIGITANFALSGSKWNSRGSDAETFIGFTETTSTTVSCDYLEVVVGRVFVAKYYDYVSALNFNDQLRFSIFTGDGVAAYNVLPDLADVTESTIEAGDPNVVTGFKPYEYHLVVLKTRGQYLIPVTDDPSTWRLIVNSKETGCDAPQTIVTTPYGVVWAKTGEDLYIFTGGLPRSLMENFLSDFRAISGSFASQWVGWYDPVTKSYKLMITTDGTTLTTVYEVFFEVRVESASGLPAFAITKHTYASGIAGIAKKSDGTVYLNSTTATAYFSPLSTTDGETAAGDGLGTKIPLYFKVDGIVPDEKNLVCPTRWYISNEQSGTPANQLDLKVSVDGTQISNPTAITKTGTYWSALLPQTNGKKISFEFNTNATKATWPSLTVNELGIEFEIRKIVGDKRTQL